MAVSAGKHRECGRWVFSCFPNADNTVSICRYSYYGQYEPVPKYSIHFRIPYSQLLPEEIVQLVACEVEQT